MNVINILEKGMTNIDVVFVFTNYGGCGVVAQAMHTVLAKLNVDVKVVLVTDNDQMCISRRSVNASIARLNATDINDYYDKILPNFNPRVSPDPLNHHIAVEVDGKLYDSRGKFKGVAVSDEITPATLAKLLAADCWNDHFRMSNSNIADIPAEMLLQVKTI